MKNILVTGSKGQLGLELSELSNDYKNFNFFFTDKDDLNINEYDAIMKFLVIKNINYIINCAAYTEVDKAESEPELANLINHIAVRNLAKLSKEKKIKLIHISTDYVFDGRKEHPYTESDKPNPQNIYGKTKLDGELAIKMINPRNSLIIRTSWLYSKFGDNFVKKMIDLSKTNKQISVVMDQIGSPTNASDLANIILKILPKIKNDNVEVFHYANDGYCSWYEFAKTIFKINGDDINLVPCRSDDLPYKEKRPKYSVLSTSKIKKKFKFVIPLWTDSLTKNLELFKKVKK